MNLTIGNSVTSIGARAFKGCSNLTIINSYIKDPTKIQLDVDVFKDVPKNTCVLHVPKGTKQLYYQAAQWNVFTQIKDDLDVPLSPGDVNGDKIVNVSDVTALVNMILGVTTMNTESADVNGDGKVNVSDVTALINIILGVE